MTKLFGIPWKIISFLLIALWRLVIATVNAPRRMKALAAVLVACFTMIYVTVDFTGLLSYLKEMITGYVRTNQQHAPWVISALVFGESLAGVSFFFPAMFLLIALGPIIMTAGIDQTTIVFLVLATWVSACAGDWISYSIGRRSGNRVLGWWPFRDFPHEVQSGMYYANRYGAWAVWIARICGPARAFAVVAVGIANMSWLRFQTHNWTSGFAWAVLLWGMSWGLANGSGVAQFIAHWFF